MKRRLRWGRAAAACLAFGLGGLCAALMAPPARLADWALSAGTDGRIRLIEPSGSLWHGSAVLAVRQGSGYAAVTDRLSWRVTPSWRGLDASVSAPCCTTEPLRLHAGIRDGGLVVEADPALLRWRAEWLESLGSPWNTLQAKGAIAIKTNAIFAKKGFFGENIVNGSATVSLENMCLSLTTLCPVGSYEIALSTESGLQMKTTSGALQLSGTGGLKNGSLRFVGLAEAEAEKVGALSNTLNLLGRRDGNKAHISINP